MGQAQIMVHEHSLPMGRSWRTYEWQGSRYDTTVVRGWSLFERLQKEAPWPLKVVDEDQMRGRLTIARADGPAALSYAYHSIKAWWKCKTGMTKARFIMTLMVWNLAHIPDGEAPDWCHVGKKR